jgi:hypothetical protein
MIERDSSLAAQAHSGLATLYRKAGSAVKAQHEMQEPRLEQLWSNPRRASIWFKFLVQARVDYRHGLRLVCHPEIVDVFQTALATQPRFTEPVELSWSPLPWVRRLRPLLQSVRGGSHAWESQKQMLLRSWLGSRATGITQQPAEEGNPGRTVDW